jgi:hypothetical protein
MVSRGALLGTLFWAAACGAAELEGVKLEDRVQVDGQSLQLNGIALRTRYVFVKVYVAGLYLPERMTTVGAVLQSKGAKRINLVMVREADASQFVESISTGLRINHTDAELEAAKAQIDALFAMIHKAGVAKVGTSIVLDFAPSAGATTLYIDGKVAGPPMAGEEFFRMLLRIWLGERPAQEDLKEALLGGK